VIVLKGPASLVTDGTASTHNETGNPGMATAGTGDVLTGIITALVGQQLSAFDAARLGTWIHGAAGDAVAKDLGEFSMHARVIVEALHHGFLALQQKR
jgi:NAD(P)H-hydrate epimerase